MQIRWENPLVSGHSQGGDIARGERVGAEDFLGFESQTTCWSNRRVSKLSTGINRKEDLSMHAISAKSCGYIYFNNEDFV